jgi:hypothetical protein
MKDFVRVSQAKDLPFRPSTLFKWHHIGRYPELFSKVGHSLFVDVRKLAALFEAGRGQGPRRGNGDE